MPDTGRYSFSFGKTGRMAFFANTLKILGTGGILFFVLGTRTGYLLLVASILAFFLGVTDFGRSCPLLLSTRRIANKLRESRTSKGS